MKEPRVRGEPTNEEILASIREVVTERAGSPQGDEADVSAILDLTQEIRDDGSVVDIETGATVVGAAAEAPGGSGDGLVGTQAETASSAAFANVAEAADESASVGETGGRTVEEVAKEVMRPLIKEWLDANLPRIVERLVQREVERLSRRGESAADS